MRIFVLALLLKVKRAYRHQSKLKRSCDLEIGVYLVEDDGSVTVTKTRSIAWDLGCGEPVVKVDGKRGGYLLSRITVR